MIKGFTYLLIGELFFTLATVFAKYMTNSSDVPAIEATFFRFLIGFLVAAFSLLRNKSSFKPNRLDRVILRGVLNTIAVILFFASVQYTTVTNANMLNLTYPIFIFLIAPFLNKEHTPHLFYPLLILAMIGIYLILTPDFRHIRFGDILGLLSGIIAAFGVITLREARKTDSTSIILFYLMGIGTVINLAVVLPSFKIPHGLPALELFLSALAGVAGQVFLTSGYKYISAKGGGIVSSSRILFGGLFGILLFQEPLSLSIALGGLCILSAIIGVNFLMQGEKQPPG